MSVGRARSLTLERKVFALFSLRLLFQCQNKKWDLHGKVDLDKKRPRCSAAVRGEGENHGSPCAHSEELAHTPGAHTPIIVNHMAVLTVGRARAVTSSGRRAEATARATASARLKPKEVGFDVHRRQVAVPSCAASAAPRRGGHKTKKGHHKHHQNTPQVDELLRLIRKNKLDACVRTLSRFTEEERRETMKSVYLKRTFLDYAKKNMASREAYAFLVEADKVDANLATPRNEQGGPAPSSNLIYYDTRMASRVIGVCARSGDSRLAQKAMSYISGEKGLQLNVFMYTSAINACAKNGEVDLACKLFRQSEIEDGLHPDVFMYCALFKVFRQAITNARDIAKDLVAAARSSPAPDQEGGGLAQPGQTDLHTAGIESTPTKHALLARALEYMDHMGEEGIVGDVVLYNCLISTCGRAFSLDKAESYFWEMQTLGVQPNSKTYSILIHSCLTSKEGDKALQYFRDARGQTGVINAHLCAQGIQAHAMLSKSAAQPEETLQDALALYKELVIEGIQIDGVASASLVSLAGDLGCPADKALELLNDIIVTSSGNVRENLPPEPFAVAADMCAKQNDIEGAKNILKQIRENASFVPNHELGASLINAFSKAKELATTFEVLELLLARGCLPNSYSFSGLLYACSLAGLPVLALKLYSLAKFTGAMPNGNQSSLLGTWCSSVLHAYLKTRRENHCAEEALSREDCSASAMEYFDKITTDIDGRLEAFKGASIGTGGSEATKGEIVGGIKQIYRDAVSKGYKPSVKVLDMMLECMCTDFYMERIQKVTPDPRFDFAPQICVSEGAGYFETSAFALFEEASDLGVLPPCVSQSDLEIKIDFRQLTPVVSEVCLLVLLRSLKRRWDSSEGKHDFKSLLLLLPTLPTREKEEKEEASIPMVDRKVKSLLRYIGMEYVMVDRDNRYKSDCVLCVVRPKTIRKCFSNDNSRFDSFDSFDFDDHHHNMFDSDLARQSSEIRMDYSL